MSDWIPKRLVRDPSDNNIFHWRPETGDLTSDRFIIQNCFILHGLSIHIRYLGI